MGSGGTGGGRTGSDASGSPLGPAGGVGVSTRIGGGGGKAGYGETSANTNYYKAPPGYRVEFRKGEPVYIRNTPQPSGPTTAASQTVAGGRGK